MVDRKRSQKEKDERLADKHREEEQALLQQQKEAEKAAAAAADAASASRDQRVFVVPGDPTLLQYIGHCAERIRPLPNARQQAAELARCDNCAL